jgi:hypothetical protein
MDKVALEQFSLSTSVSLANHSTYCDEIIVIHQPRLVKEVK